MRPGRILEEGLNALYWIIRKKSLCVHPRPRILNLLVTYRCNSRCSICDFWRRKDFPGELTTEKVKETLLQARALGVRYLGVSGEGEPFMRSDLFEIISYARELGLGVTLTSNGLLLTPKNIEQLKAAGLQSLTVSLDTLDDARYETIRGIPCGATRVASQIRNARDAGLAVGVGSVLLDSTGEDVLALADFCRKEGLASFRVSAYVPEFFHAIVSTRSRDPTALAGAVSRLVRKKSMVGFPSNSTAYLRGIADYARSESFFPVPCLAGSFRFHITPNGDVQTCPFITEPMGNVRESPLSDIFYSKTAVRLRRAAYRGDCPRCWLSCFAEDNLRLSWRYALSANLNALARFGRAAV